MSEKAALDKYIEITSQEVNEFVSKIDKVALEQAKTIITEAKLVGGRVHITGIGKPSHVAEYAAALYSSTGTPAYALDATEAVHGSAGQVQKNDVVIAISNSGETEELKNTIQALKKIGIQTISISGGINSWLAQHTDVFIFAGVNQEGDHLNKPPRLSIVVEILILQCLSILLQEAAKITFEDYYLWHPGGALGKAVEKLIQD